jgi:hypothetical protein
MFTYEGWMLMREEALRSIIDHKEPCRVEISRLHDAHFVIVGSADFFPYPVLFPSAYDRYIHVL